MGGIGSGRPWHWSAKDTTDDYLAIDVRQLQQLTPEVSRLPDAPVHRPLVIGRAAQAWAAKAA